MTSVDFVVLWLVISIFGFGCLDQVTDISGLLVLHTAVGSRSSRRCFTVSQNSMAAKSSLLKQSSANELRQDTLCARLVTSSEANAWHAKYREAVDASIVGGCCAIEPP